MTAATRRDPAIELVGRGAPALTYIIGTYPLLTTTFIDREIRVLRSWGAAVDVISLRRPTAVSGDQANLASTTIYVRPVKPAILIRRHIRFLLSRPVRYLSTLSRLVTGRRQSMRQRLRTIGHFGLGVYVAGSIGDSGPTDRIHAHFIDRAAIVSYVAARLLGRTPSTRNRP